MAVIPTSLSRAEDHEARYGDAVNSGRKTIKLAKGELQADADLVVTLSYKGGIGFYLPDERRWVVSYPQQHHQRELAGCGKTLLSTQGRKLSDDKRRPTACSKRIIRIGLSHAECRRDS